MRRSLAVCAMAAAALAGCDSPGKPFHYPMDGVLTYDAVQVKGTHNSYHVETIDISYWNYMMAPFDVQLDQQGARQIELDFHWIQDDDGVHHHFEVFHIMLTDKGTT